ncbi:MAG: hypothetical protein V9H69_08230 [Anaerolineae bacterium]
MVSWWHGLPIYQSTNLTPHQSTNLPIYQSTTLPIYHSTTLPLYSIAATNSPFTLRWPV